jgi:hypothetical protein
MRFDDWVFAGLALHAVLVLWITLYVLFSKRRAKKLAVGHFVFAALLPIWGPWMLHMLLRAKPPTREDAEWMRQNEEQHDMLLRPQAQALQLVPLEEAFIYNDAQRRREMMMNVLRSDPRKHIELLLLARFNDDQETAHYATATLMELQRQMQMSLQQLQVSLLKEPDSIELNESYVKELKAYIDSGLIEDKVLHQQQMLLMKALEALLKLVKNTEWMALAVQNYLALQMAREARLRAEEMVQRFPHAEESWLALTHVFVATHDEPALQKLFERMDTVDVDWTRGGLERINYFRRAERK